VLLKDVSDIELAGKCAVLPAVDMSTVFDTVNYSILCSSRLSRADSDCAMHCGTNSTLVDD